MGKFHSKKDPTIFEVPTVKSECLYGRFVYLSCREQNSEFILNSDYLFCENKQNKKILLIPNAFGKIFEEQTIDDYLIHFSDKQYGNKIKISLHKYTLKMKIFDEVTNQFYFKDSEIMDKKLDK